MKAQHLAILAGIAIIALLAALWSSEPRESAQPEQVGQLLVAELDEQLNAVNALRIDAGNGEQLDLLREDGRWLIAQKNNYPADAARIRSYLIDLAGATVTERKTANPANYGRLGVADPGEENGGVALRVHSAQETDADFSLIVGAAARGGAASYVRRSDSPATLLVNADLTLDADPLEWLDKTIIDISAERIRSVTITHPGDEVLRVAKEQREQPNFAVADVPAGRELRYESIANPLATTLAGLQMEDVETLNEESAADEVVRATFVTFDGLRITANASKRDAAHLVHFDVSFDPEQAQMAEPATEPETTEPADATQTGDSSEAAVQEEAQRLRDRLSPWQFTISKYKYDQLVRTMGDLLKESDASE